MRIPALESLLAVTALAALGAEAGGQQLGPRAFLPRAPGWTNVVEAFEFRDINLDTSGTILIDESEVDVAVYYPGLTRAFRLFDRPALVNVTLPFAQIDTNAGLAVGEESEQGIADPYVHLAVALVGGEASGKLREEDDAFTLYAFGAVRVPLGEYDDDESINIGTNRWEMRFGLPMVGVWGPPQEQTSFELFPSVSLFTDNTRPFGGDDLEQDPLYRVETHLTRQVSSGTWLSVDGGYASGGETSLDGVEGDDGQKYTSLGASLGIRLSPKFTLTGSYARYFSGDGTVDDGDFVGLTLVYEL